MGSDEYHEKYPGAAEGGLRNNAYTNIIAVWCLARALETLDLLAFDRREEITALLDLGAAERERWRDITRRMAIPFHGDGIISQFEGYADLPELDWEGYRARFGRIDRLDRILKADGDSPDRYQVSKQPDVVMAFYLLTRKELRAIFEGLGYAFDDDLVARNVRF